MYKAFNILQLSPGQKYSPLLEFQLWQLNIVLFKKRSPAWSQGLSSFGSMTTKARQGFSPKAILENWLVANHQVEIRQWDKQFKVQDNFFSMSVNNDIGTIISTQLSTILVNAATNVLATLLKSGQKWPESPPRNSKMPLLKGNYIHRVVVLYVQ